MSDTASTDAPTDNGTPEAGESGAPEVTIESLTAELEALKGNSRKWEDRAKANAAAAKALEELKNANLSDEEKRTKAFADLEKRAAEAEAAKADAEKAALRLRVAARHGLTEEEADLILTAADEATMTRQAEVFAGRSTGSKPNPAQGKGVTAPSSPEAAAKELLGGLFR